MPGKTSFLLAAALAGLLLRLAFGLGYWVNKPLTRDEAEYLSLARSLAAGHGFVYDATLQAGPVEPFGRAPGYPFWLAITGPGNASASSVPASVKIVQAITGVAGVLLIGTITRRLAGSNAATVAAALAAVYPPLVWMSAFALSEAVFWPLALLAAWVFDRSLKADVTGRRSVTLGLAAGALLGAAVLVRPATSIALLMGGAWLAWRRRPGLLAAVALGAVLVIGPWSARNVAHYGRFVLVATEGGVTFWTGNNALARGEGDMAANPDIKLASQALKRSHPELNEESMEPLYYREALEWIGSHPVDWTILEARKLFFLIVPIGPSYRGHSPRYFWASVLSYALALPLAIAGAWRLRGRFSRTPGFWLIAGSAVVVCLVFFPQDRFRVPLIDSALVICAGVALGGVREEPGVVTVLVVMPTYNERPNLERVAAAILRHDFARLLVVDDGSPDGTGQLADELAARSNGRVEVMHRTGPRGLGLAYIDGLTRALATGADAICQMDADLSHDPKYLPDLAAAIERFDLVIGSRYLHGVSVVNWPLHRLILSAFANRYIRFVTGLSPNDCTGAYRMWRRAALAKMPLDHARTSGYAFLTEMLYEAAQRHCTIGEVPIVFVEREDGYSKVSSSVLFESLLTPWRLVLRGGRLKRSASA